MGHNDRPEPSLEVEHAQSGSISEASSADTAAPVVGSHQLSIVFAHSPLSTLLFTPDGLLISINDAALHLFGITPEHAGQLIGHYNLLTDQKMESSGLTEQIHRAFDGEPVEIPIVKYNGSGLARQTGLWISGSAFPVKDNAGNLDAVVMQLRDVIEWKLTEEELQEGKERYRLLADASFEGIMIHDKGVALEVNDALLRMTGYDRSEFIGQNRIDILTLGSEAEFWRHVLSGSEEPYEINIRRKDGSEFPAEVRGKNVQYKGQSLRITAARDISDRKIMEEALRQSEERFRTLADASFEGIVIHDKGVAIEVNDAFLRMTGYDRSEMIGVDRTDIMAAEGRKIAMQRINDNSDEPYEAIIIRKDGSTFPAEMRGKQINYKGRAVRVTAARDITASKRAEEALRKSEERFRILTDAAFEGLVIHDSGVFLDVNDAFVRMIGYNRLELLGSSVNPYITPESLEVALWHANNHSEEPYEITMRRKDGTTLPLEAQGRDIDYKGIPARVVSVRDVTERKRAEEEIRMLAAELEHRVHERTAQLEAANIRLKELEFIVNKSAAVAFLWRAVEGWPVEYVSENIRQFDYSPNDLMSGRVKYTSIIHPDDLRDVADEVTRYTTEGRTEFSQEYRILTASGNIRWIDDQTWIRRDEQGNATHYQGIIFDITERKLAEEERLIRSAQLESLNKEMEAFSYSVSHDLRTPLRSIDGFSQALLEDYADTLDLKGKDYLQRVRAAAQRMGLLIDDMLRLSRLTRSEMIVADVDLSSMALQIVTELKGHDPERQVDFIIEPDIVVKGDRNLLQMVVENLLDNAWKFTRKVPKAKIEMGVVRRDDEPVYFIKDNGAGFDIAYASKLFAPFQRLHSEADFPGSGIGLAIVRRVIHRHDGRIWAEGAVGQGAAFYFTLSAKSDQSLSTAVKNYKSQ